VTWDYRGDLRADPGIAPGERNISRPKKRSIWPSIAVVAAAVAFGGVIWFAYRSGRDATHSGIPPLVKAETSPVKVKPENPGGAEIPFQDSTVYDKLDGQGGQKPVVEKLLPPTEAPIERPQAPQADALVAAPTPDVTPPPAPQANLAPSAPPASVSPPTQPVIIAPAPQSVAQGPDTSSPTALAPAPGQMIIQPAPPPQIAKPAQAAPQKLAAIEPPKPTSTKPAAKQMDSIAALINSHEGTAPAHAAGGGGYRLQLSAVKTQDAVEPEWARLKHRFPELAALKIFSSKIDVAGKGTFYRVEAGPLDEAAAKSTCTHLRVQGTGCIVVKP